LETGWRGRSHVAHFRSSRRDHRAALLPAVHYRPFGSGVVRARTRGAGGYALPALCAVQSGLDAGAVELSGPGGTIPGDANAGLRLVGRIFGIRSVMRVHVLARTIGSGPARN